MTVSALADRLPALREEMKRQGLSALVIPRADHHQGEYVAARSERLAWTTGFTGSAGLAIVTLERAAMFVDGRYVIQAREQVPGDLFAVRHLRDAPPADWLAEVMDEGEEVGFDPWLHTLEGVAALRAGAEAAGARLRPVERNPVDAVWSDRPPAPLDPLVAHEDAYAGDPSAEKRARIGAALSKQGLDAAVLSAPESLCWLLNVRGSDTPCTPLALAFSIVYADGTVDVFVDERKIDDALRAHVGAAARFHAPERFEAALAALGGKTVRLDAASAPWSVAERLSAVHAFADVGMDPCALPRACRTPVELEGARDAHRRDGAAMVRFLCWLDAQVAAGAPLTELSAARTLGAMRARDALYRGPSFETISAAGAHGAICHYRVDGASDLALSAGPVFLIDSGGQYLNGTTDVTRAIAVGAPSGEMRRRFTLVLKGHIALATLRFPAGTAGGQLDAIARQHLWAHGLDYDHGTGHGVGNFLSVHEGPQRIAKGATAVALRPGMILSNEPGYYKEGGYGIRIENLVVVQPLDPQPEGAERQVLGFETLTLAPIDRRLVETALLRGEERAWLNAYHQRVRRVIGPWVDGAERDWLRAATEPLAADRPRP